MLGIICAMSEELEAVTDRMKDVKVEQIADVTFHIGTLHDQKLVLALAGVGKVRASMATTLLCDHYHPQALINLGVAGGLRKEQQVEDLVISDEILQADFDTTAIDGPAGLGLKYQAEPAMVEKAVCIAQKMNMPYRVGTIASQDLFMARDEDFQKLMSRFPQSACSEMEGGAVAAVAAAFEIPVLVLRNLSDVVHHESNNMEFSTFVKRAARRGADLLEEWTMSE